MTIVWSAPASPTHPRPQHPLLLVSSLQPAGDESHPVPGPIPHTMSTANKDEAIKCLGLAQKYFDNSNWSLARKYANKSIGLFATPEASKLLNLINQREAAGASGSGSGETQTRSNDTSVHTEESTAGTRHRHTSHANRQSFSSTTKEKGKEKAREYTPEQAAVVAQIRKCKVTEYYEILSLKKECDENDVKKAYRKVRSFSGARVPRLQR